MGRLKNVMRNIRKSLKSDLPLVEGGNQQKVCNPV
jgi:hypothetical protein